MKNFTTHATQHFGQQLMIGAIAHTITSLAEKTGKLKNGQDAPYLVVTAADGKTDMLHPRTAVTLFSKGEAAGIQMLVDAVASAPVATPAPVVTAPVAKAAKPVAAKDNKKKQAMITIFNEVVAAKGTRQEVIQRFMSETGGSLNCANTYYQNCRGGAWA